MDTLYLDQYSTQGAVTSALLATLSTLKLVVFDVDGVLTDGGLFYGADGEMIKRFSVKDGVAMKLLPKWGVSVAVISAKDSQPLRQRMQDLGVQHAYFGVHDKAAVFQTLLAQLKIPAESTAYVGDDVIDLQVMPFVGVAMCPADAHALVKRHCQLTLLKAGGQGVAREVADLILATRMTLESAYQLAIQPSFEKSTTPEKTS